MIRKPKAAGFSLIELLLVLAIMGIIAGIAIPSFLSQRRRARLIGDAQANAQVLRMQLETYKADSGAYAAGSTTYAWTASGGITGGAAASALNFNPKGNSQMDYSLKITAGGQAYTISVTDPSINTMIYKIDQNGAATITPY
jgi:prepilin-type N-terminal cleavage/methylation domain-containing protein